VAALKRNMLQCYGHVLLRKDGNEWVKSAWIVRLRLLILEVSLERRR